MAALKSSDPERKIYRAVSLLCAASCEEGPQGHFVDRGGVRCQPVGRSDLLFGDPILSVCLCMQREQQPVPLPGHLTL